MPTEAPHSMPIGTRAPAFSLIDTVRGTMVSLEDFQASKVLVVLFICRHCPYVVHVRSELVQIARAYQARGVAFVAISANDAETYPEDAPDKLAEMARECAFPFPMLYDETQEVARAYGAACTPDIFVFDTDRKLAYRGRLDASTPGNGLPVTGEDLRGALDALLSGKAVAVEYQPSLGCSIKWRHAG